MIAAVRGAAVALLALIALGILAACSATSHLDGIQPASIASPQAATLAKVAVAQRTYANACGTCHDRGGLAVRVLADRLGPAQSLLHEGTRLPREAMRVIVRRGLGAMPAMSRLEVSDPELEAILDSIANAGRSGARQ